MIATTLLLSLAQAQSFVETLTSLHDHNLNYGQWDNNSADYEKLIYDQTLNKHEERGRDLHDIGRDFILNDNSSQVPFDLDEKRCYQNGSGVWCNHAEKSGSVKTIIPAKVIETETYQETCEEGATKECYLNKNHECQKWHLNGDLSNCKEWCGYTKSEYENTLSSSGYGDKYSKSCGNTAVLSGLDNELYQETFDCRAETPIWDVDTIELVVDFADELDEDIRNQVYAQIRKQVGDLISTAVSFSVTEALESVITV